MSSIVEADPLSLSELESMPPHGELDQPQEGTNLLGLAWRSRWMILLCTLLGAGTAWILLQRVTPRYLSVSRIYVEKNMPRFLATDLQTNRSASYLYTQAELMVSTPVLVAAADAPGNATLETFREVENRVGFLKKAIVVSVGKLDDIINISTELANANDAAQLVNSVVDAYVTKYAEQRRTSTVEVLNILHHEKQRRDTELEDRRKAIADFRAQHPALAVRVDDENIITRRYSALAEELNATELDLLQAKARFHRVQKMYDTPSLRPLLLDAAGMQQQSMRDMSLESQTQIGLEKLFQDIELRLTSERSTWGDGHPRVKLLRESLAEIQKRLASQEEEIKKQKQTVIESYVDTVRQEYELLEHKYNELQQAHGKQYKLAMDVSSQMLQLISLEESLERTEKLCDILDDRIKEVNLTEEVGAMNVSIMEVAGPSSAPSYPKPSKFIALGILLGGLSGFGLTWLRELLDHRLKSIEEIASVLQLPILGVVPYLKGQQERSQVGQVITLQPQSKTAESIRTLRTAMHFGLAGDETKTIVVTSPSPSEGKSTVASNLAIAMAQAGRKVILIDADLRKPTQHEIFHVSQTPGLSTVLSERTPVEEAILRSVVDSLDLLPSGPVPSNPVELLNNDLFEELLETLKGRYDKIVLDTAPVMPVADARVVAAISDSCLMVLRAERSTRRLSVAARNELWQVRARRLGVVVNGVPLRKQGGYGYGYGYGYGDYGYTGETYGTVEAPKGGKALPAPLE
jgi:capsular exopolysaccharide synthesis family protein